MEKKKKEEKKENSEKENKEEGGFFDMVDVAQKKPRIMGLYGDLTEEKASELVYTMFMLSENAKFVLTDELKEKLENLGEDEEIDTKGLEKESFKFIVSTYGGSVDEMFSLYDVFRIVRKNCDIETLGLGKVKSAGVLLLASGTKGKRKIGRNCRVMIHNIGGGNQGKFHDMKVGMKQLKNMKKRYIKCLLDETKLTKPQISRFMNKKEDVYLTSEQAIQYGIADEII